MSNSVNWQYNEEVLMSPEEVVLLKDSFGSQVDYIKRIDAQYLSNLFHFMRLFPNEYHINTKNLIRCEIQSRRISVLPYRPEKRFATLISKLKQSGFVENKLYEDGADIVFEGRSIGEIV